MLVAVPQKSHSFDVWVRVASCALLKKTKKKTDRESGNERNGDFAIFGVCSAWVYQIMSMFSGMEHTL